MQITKRLLSNHRRARLIVWTLAMLMWMASVILGSAAFTSRHERQRGARMSLDRLTRTVKLLILHRAHDFALRRRRGKRRAPSYRGRELSFAGILRASIGPRVRRMLKRKAIGARIAVLIHALRHLDDCAALVAKRLKRGLTRRWFALFGPARAPATTLATLAAPETCFVDSS